VDLNRDLVLTRFQDIEQSVARLEQIKELPLTEFLADRDVLDVTCYRLLVAIEAAIQICFHVCVRKLGRTGTGYAECFQILGEGGILDAGLCENLQRMARFRNMLVHVYWTVDYERVYDILHEHLDDLKAFVRAIAELL